MNAVEKLFCGVSCAFADAYPDIERAHTGDDLELEIFLISVWDRV